MRSVWYGWLLLRSLRKWDCGWVFRRLGLSYFYVFVLEFLGGFRSRRLCSGKGEGERLCCCLEELGPSFIKLGQGLSVRSDLLGRDLTDSLRRLQSGLEGVSFEEVEGVISESFGKDWRELYSTLSRDPVGAASVAQVHRGTTHEGEEVAVKVLRPGIVEKFSRDIRFFYDVAWCVERLVPRLRRLNLRRMVDEFASWTSGELDLRREGASAAELRMNFRGDSHIFVPKVKWSLTNEKVMTCTWVEGVRIDDEEGRRRLGLDDGELLARCAEIFFLQAFRDGFFHADLHPGNVFVDGAGRICPVDFGIMGRIDRKRKRYLGLMLSSFMRQDYEELVEVHEQAGMLPVHVDKQRFKQAMIAIGESAFENEVVDISIARLLGKMFERFKEFQMTPKPELLLLEKTMLMAEGLGLMLDSEVNIWSTVLPSMEAWVRKDKGLRTRGEDFLERVIGFAEKVEEGVSVPLPSSTGAEEEEGKMRGREVSFLLCGLVMGSVWTYFLLWL